MGCGAISASVSGCRRCPRRKGVGAAAHAIVIAVEAHALEEWRRWGSAEWTEERGVFVGMEWAGWQGKGPNHCGSSIVVLGLGVGYRGNGDFAVFELFAIFISNPN